MKLDDSVLMCVLLQAYSLRNVVVAVAISVWRVERPITLRNFMLIKRWIIQNTLTNESAYIVYCIVLYRIKSHWVECFYGRFLLLLLVLLLGFFLNVLYTLEATSVTLHFLCDFIDKICVCVLINLSFSSLLRICWNVSISHFKIRWNLSVLFNPIFFCFLLSWNYISFLSLSCF